MNRLPYDIKRKIDQLYTNAAESRDVEELIVQLWNISLNVGPEQLARSILVLAEGDINEIKRIIDSGFFGDPRDVIMRAENKIGNPKHYFIKPFS